LGKSTLIKGNRLQIKVLGKGFHSNYTGHFGFILKGYSPDLIN